MLNKLKHLKNNQGFMKYFKNTSWLFIERILRLIVGFFVLVWLIKYLGPKQYGYFAYAQSFVFLFTAVTTLGLDAIVTRELVKNPNRQTELLGTSFYMKLIGSIVLLIVLTIAIQFTSNDNMTNLFIFIIASSTIFQSFNVINFYFQAKVIGQYAAFSNIFVLVFSSLIKVYFIINNYPLIAFVWIVVFDNFLLAISLFYFYMKKNVSFIKLTFKKDIALELLKDSWPLIITGISYNIYSSVDQIMLFNLMDAKHVGYYSTGVQFVNAFIFIPTIIMNTLYPYLIKQYEINKIAFKEKITYIYKGVVLISFLYIIFMYLFGNDVIILLYGDDYLITSKIIFMLSIGFLFESLAIVNGRWIWIKNLQIISLYRTLFGAILNIGLNLYLIPIYGINGAIYATLITLLFSVVLFYLVFEKTREITILQIVSIVSFYNFKGVKQWVKR